jgi:hypothetical protein
MEVFSFDLTQVSSRSADDISKLFMLCRESVSTDALAEYHRQAQILNRFVIAELIQTDTIVTTIRREFKKLFPGVKITDEDLQTMLANGVLKRDTIDGDPPKEAKAMIKKATTALAKRVAKAKA